MRHGHYHLHGWICKTCGHLVTDATEKGCPYCFRAAQAAQNVERKPCHDFTPNEDRGPMCVCGFDMRDHEPEEYMTPDGYRFFQYPDGRYGDNKDRKKADMIFESFDDLVREVKDEH